VTGKREATGKCNPARTRRKEGQKGTLLAFATGGKGQLEKEGRSFTTVSRLARRGKKGQLHPSRTPARGEREGAILCLGEGGKGKRFEEEGSSRRAPLASRVKKGGGQGKRSACELKKGRETKEGKKKRNAHATS